MPTAPRHRRADRCCSSPTGLTSCWPLSAPPSTLRLPDRHPESQHRNRDTMDDHTNARSICHVEPLTMDPAGSFYNGFPEAGQSHFGFHLLAELGRGAFGRVFLAKQESLAHRLVVLKVG